MRGPRKKRNPPAAPQPPAPADLVAKDAMQDVMAERRRQVEVAGYSHGHDDGYRPGVLARAGAAYALHAARPQWDVPPPAWPWRADLFRPSTPRRSLVKAAALLIAEIERIDRETLRLLSPVAGPVPDDDSAPQEEGDAS